MTSNNKKINTALFEDLTPDSSSEQKEVYFETLSWALKNQNVKNIAITGPYGSGKSSILKAFFKKNDAYQELNISLATFKNTTTETELPDKKKKEQNKSIELSILQQIFYKVKAEEIPFSRFQRIKTLSSPFITLVIIEVLLGLSGMSLIFGQSFYSRFSGWEDFIAERGNGLQLFSILLILPGIIHATFHLLNKLNNSKLNKLNFKSGDVELTPQNDTSILNKNIDEILYFFESTDYNVVVIEDLDRFNNPEIFTKLREINNLINNSKQIARRIVFIYAIKDDMFTDNNRSKFFDFIIPVIPVINTSNSIELALKKIANTDINLSRRFLRNVSLYIDDMRLLKNIFNEFLVYSEILKPIDVNSEKLFSIIIYKNKYPVDFAKLHDNSGMIYEAFSHTKFILIGKLIKQKQTEINALNEEIRKINGVLITSLKELRSLYIFEFIKNFPYATAIRMNNTDVNFEEILTDEKFKEFSGLKEIQYTSYEHGRSYRGSNFSFQKLESILDKIPYSQKELLIRQKTTTKVNENRELIDQLAESIKNIRSQKLCTLFNENEIDDSLLSDDLSKERLLLFLLRHGYIDEMYPSLISYFYEGSLTNKDKAFLISVNDRKVLPFNHQLSNMPELTEQIDPAAYSHPEILNNNLVSFLIKNINNESLSIAFKKIVGQLMNSSKRSMDFIENYIDQDEHELPYFINFLSSTWPKWWQSLTSAYPSDKTAKFLRKIIVHSDIDNLKKINIANQLTNLISNLGNIFLGLLPESQNHKKIEEVITELLITFPSVSDIITFDTFHYTSYFDFIYANNAYEITYNNIKTILEKKHPGEHLAKLNTQNYSTIKQSGCAPLISYIEDSIEIYIEDVFLTTDIQIEEPSEILIELLANEVVEEDLREQIIDKYSGRLPALESIEKTFWRKLIETNKIEATWQNVFDYYTHVNSLDESLINYLNAKKNYTLLSVNKPIWSDLTEEMKHLYVVFFDLLGTDKISDDSFTHIMIAVPETYVSKIPLKPLSQKKSAYLVENNLIELSTTNVDLLKTKSENLHIKLIEKNIDSFSSNYTEYKLTYADFTMLLSSSSIGLNSKMKIVEKLKSEDFSKSKEMADVVAEIIKATKYNHYSFDIIKMTISLANQQNKIELLIIYIERISFDQIDELLNKIGLPYSDLSQKNKHCKLPVTKLNFELLEKLGDRDYISSYREEEGEKSNFIRVYLKKT